MSLEKVPEHIKEYLKEVLKREERLAREFSENKVFEADMADKPKVFVTFPYPYMNGSLHLGHAYSSGRLDVYARFKRLKGFNVLYPWAWHWTGEAVYGTVHRLRMNDQEVIDRLVKLDGVDPDDIEKLKDPIYFVKYFTEKNRDVVIRYGLSVDMSREFHTTSLHPLYNRFVEWQIRRLYDLGYIVKGSHPVVWCPVDQSPTGDHDRLEGEGVRPEQYYLIKFRFGDAYLVAGTLRPETIFGVTNIWVNPEATYVEALVEGEKWIISVEAASKLREQLKRVEELNRIWGWELIGKWAEAPITGRKIPILPASFVDPDSVTGVVYSVPAHAPYDYLALRDLKRNPPSKEIGDLVRDIEPISIIEIEGYGEYPAVEMVEAMAIESQEDVEKAEEATKKIYMEEFNKGVMKGDLPYIGGMPTSEARKKIFEVLREMGLADQMYDLPEPVICRCTAKCIVKILPDQWFLKYSDQDWKEKAHKAVNNMSFYPEEIRNLFHHYIDWYEDWPCTRRSGLGTPFPMDKSWIVETLTDSTIYQAFYIIARYYNMGWIDPDRITDSFFNYVFLGQGHIDKVAEEAGLSPDQLQRIREDFLYWYPVDIRGSGKDLIGNHLTFFIFHHVAIFPEEKWPRGIAANGFTMLNGMPMSKSKGNYLSIRDAIKLVSADALRLSILSLVDGLDDPDWNVGLGYNALAKMRGLEGLVEKIYGSDVEEGGDEFLDKWVVNNFYKLVSEAEEALENFRIAFAARIIYDNMVDTIKKYLQLVDSPNTKLLRMLTRNLIILSSLYTPYLSQYLWRNVLKEDGYVFFSEYKVMEADTHPLLIDEYLETLAEDIIELIRVVGSGKVVVRVSDDDLWSLFKKLSEIDGDVSVARKVVRENLKDGRKIGEVMKYIGREWFGRMKKFRQLYRELDREDEKRLLEKYLHRYLARHGFPVETIVVDDESNLENISRRKPAYPLYPAIYIVK